MKDFSPLQLFLMCNKTDKNFTVEKKFVLLAVQKKC